MQEIYNIINIQDKKSILFLQNIIDGQ